MQFEQYAKEEAEKLNETWNSGFYNFLLKRVTGKYLNAKNKEVRSRLEEKLNLTFPAITDQMLLSLYMKACIQYLRGCDQKYGPSSGFLKTPSENQFSCSFESIIKENKVLKHLEIYPSQYFSRDLPANFKMVVGNYVPDFLVFGLKINGSSAVAIEIDGDSHILKSAKDELRNSHLKEIKIFACEIPNNQSKDIPYLTKAILSMYRLRNGSFNEQIQRAKRQIWVKTIACHLSLDEIETLVLTQFSIQLNLAKEAEAIANLKICSRKVKKEIKKIHLK